MALKSVDDVDNNGFDDELTTTKIAYLAKNFRNFLRNNNKRARGKNNAELRSFRRNDRNAKSNLKDLMVVNTTVVKVPRRGAKANEKQLEGWQKNKVRHLTFKECEQKEYLFPDENVPNILKQLLQMNLIELPECKKPEDTGKVDDPNCCKYYRIISHPIQKCFIFKEQIMKLAKKK